MNLRFLLAAFYLVLALGASGQLEWTRVSFECPCTLTSEDGETATLEFGLQNHSEEAQEGLRATLGLVGTSDLITESGTSITTALVDTIEIETLLEPHDSIPTTQYTIDLGVLPRGRLYFELVLHIGPANQIDDPYDGDSPIRDAIWFKDLVTSPPSSLNLTNMDFLVDTDEDGVHDMNEEMQGTDPNDPESLPDDPVIDVLFAYQSGALDFFGLEPNAHLKHLVAVTEYFFESSGTPITLRPVGLVDENEVSELGNQQALFLGAVPAAERQSLLDKYRADSLVVYRQQTLPDFSGLCGVAEGIGGWGGKGFIHPNEREIYTEVYLNPNECGITTTAHEIGHLMGLGHSFNQGSVGTFPWSRGHGVEAEFATIMTYARPAYAAVEVHVMSNPELDCHGNPCGVSHHDHSTDTHADAALTLNITKHQFADGRHPNPNFDYDNDGYGADVDIYPLDGNEWTDSDGDGHGDNGDAFVNDPTEWADTDGDGIGDNSDPDIDNDGVLNVSDPDPFDSETTSVSLLEIVSDRFDDDFGRIIARIDDLDSDGNEDFAIAAPRNKNLADIASGTVYLITYDDFLAEPDLSDPTNRTRSLADLRSDSDTWQIHGVEKDELLGSQVTRIEHPVGSTTNTELVLSGSKAIYLLQLTSEALSSLDTEDGTTDRQINLENCTPDLNCYRIGLGDDFVVRALTRIEDLDDDGLNDLGVVGVNETGDATILYVMTRSGITSQVQASEDNTANLVEIWEHDSSSFQVSTASFFGLVQLTDLGDVLSGSRHELAIGVEGSAIAGSNDEFARLYLLSTDQFNSLSTLDTDGDRKLDIDDFVRLGGSRKVTSWEDGLGRGIDIISDVDGDEKDDIFVWGSSGSNYVFAINSLVSMDIVDTDLDGHISLRSNAQITENVWLFNVLTARLSPQQKVFKDPDGTGLPDLLVARRFDDLLVAPLTDYDYLDDPTLEDLNAIINLPVRIRSPGIYLIRFPFGPSAIHAYSSITPLGDLDADQISDFAVSLHSGETEGSRGSIHVIYSSTLPILDAVDQAEDHNVALHNNFQDTDGDGILNLHDQDDDGDGLHDTRDRFPLLADYQYDADFDGFANALDAFDLDASEQFDMDGDGVGDNTDLDVDGDGIANDDDEFPFDTDNDGQDNSVDLDDDNDGTPDDEDAFPLDPTETIDSDGDGVGDVADVFDDDPTEWFDTDEDGIGNNADTDDDNDGYLDVDDAFPTDPTEWVDSDGDGHGDNSDQFPNNPLEWEDLDGDGLGDNYGVLGFSSYRLASAWFRLPTITSTLLPIAESLSMGDFDKDGYDDVMIANSRFDRSNQPIFLLSSKDLEELDELDGQNNRLIKLTSVHEGPNSWQFANQDRTFRTTKLVQATAGDMNGDGFSDFMVAGPYDFDQSGSAFLVYGHDFAGLDAADGEVDSDIDYYTCVRRRECVLIRSNVDEHVLSLQPALFRNIFGQDKVAVSLSTVNSRRRSELREGIGAAYILSHDAIERSLEGSANSTLYIQDAIDQDGTYVFYPEYNATPPGANANALLRMSDYDKDGTNDLAFVFRQREIVYFIASSDLANADLADGETDGHINIRDAYDQTNSYKAEGFLLLAGNPIGQIPLDEDIDTSRKSYFSMAHVGGSTFTGYLFNSGTLGIHDAEDGTTDSIIKTIRTDSDIESWGFPNWPNTAVCERDSATGQTRAFSFSVTQYFVPNIRIEIRLIGFNVADLADLDSLDGTSDGIVDLPNALDEGYPDVWEIQLGDFGENLRGFLVDCTGDMDQDGYTDFILSLVELRGTNPQQLQGRTNIVFLMHSDLELLDDLDGTKDNHLDVSRLWDD